MLITQLTITSSTQTMTQQSLPAVSPSSPSHHKLPITQKIPVTRQPLPLLSKQAVGIGVCITSPAISTSPLKFVQCNSYVRTCHEKPRLVVANCEEMSTALYSLYETEVPLISRSPFGCISW